MKRSDRLRAAGWVVLASGLVAAAVFYWVKTRELDPTLDDSTALGYKRSLQHGIGVMMGRSGELLTDASNILTSPGGKALMIVVCAALFAAYFFRVAWVIDDDNRTDDAAADKH
ncbi:MAG TPA: hypothetical protein VGY57_01490 [Vicinamibacterales bacterium]|jgi:hypothetical protein|nr:hypothetical protein [Vicinamibacterales bacterium]